MKRTDVPYHWFVAIFVTTRQLFPSLPNEFSREPDTMFLNTHFNTILTRTLGNAD
jgi:hypothetical protein